MKVQYLRIKATLICPKYAFWRFLLFLIVLIELERLVYSKTLNLVYKCWFYWLFFMLPCARSTRESLDLPWTSWLAHRGDTVHSSTPRHPNPGRGVTVSSVITHGHNGHPWLISTPLKLECNCSVWRCMSRVEISAADIWSQWEASIKFILWLIPKCRSFFI